MLNSFGNIDNTTVIIKFVNIERVKSQLNTRLVKKCIK